MPRPRRKPLDSAAGARPLAHCADCTSPAPAAYQYTTFPLGTEDCLTLDIYSSAEAKKRPVLVYLHGSAATGSSLELPGSELVRDAGCVFVALNYRLGLFGWNCLPALTADPDATGNFALLDIARALDWVRDNICRFGGDADNIILCGFSDGGRMAAALAGSPLFRERFQKAVAISGGCPSPTRTPPPRSWLKISHRWPWKTGGSLTRLPPPNGC